MQVSAKDLLASRPCQLAASIYTSEPDSLHETCHSSAQGGLTLVCWLATALEMLTSHYSWAAGKEDPSVENSKKVWLCSQSAFALWEAEFANWLGILKRL